MNLRWAFLDRYADCGLLIIRLGLGAMFLIYHGWPKLIGGPDEWRNVGRAVGYLGLRNGYTAWGFVAALAECGGGLCLMLGFAARPVALALAIEMGVATIWRYYPFHTTGIAAHPFELAIVFLGLCITGPGKLSLDSCH
ncbi:MAG TPA: DoxX family protein [Opitutaceae bacterium]|jgi:putative oxidoreductase|nr:DoxX family protein [Opitutaceae bacterium]